MRCCNASEGYDGHRGKQQTNVSTEVIEIFVLMVRKPLMPVRGMRGELTRLPPCASHFPFSPPGLSQITWSTSVEKGRGYYKLGPQATLCWRKASYHVDVHELSLFHNPILSRTARCKTPCVQGGTHPFLHATNSDTLHERMIGFDHGAGHLGKITTEHTQDAMQIGIETR